MVTWSISGSRSQHRGRRTAVTAVAATGNVVRAPMTRCNAPTQVYAGRPIGFQLVQHAAGDAAPGAPDRLGVVVIRVLVDHDGRPVVVHQQAWINQRRE